MMNNKLLAALFCAGIGLGMTTVSHANDKVASIYNPQTYQKVCKGKSAGTPVSFAARGIMWNGTCETQFIPAKKGSVQGDEPELFSTCASDDKAKTATLDGQEVKGDLDKYKLLKFIRSNQGTCYNQRPIVAVGNRLP